MRFSSRCCCCHESLTRRRLDNVRFDSVGLPGKVQPRAVGSGAGLAVPPWVEGFHASDLAVGALAPEVPSEVQAVRNKGTPFHIFAKDENVASRRALRGQQGIFFS